MSLSKRLFWGPVTTQFVEEAILENESLVLIDAVKNRIGALLENVFYRDATKIADAVAYKIGHLCIDMSSRKIDTDNFVVAISGLRQSVITAIQMRTVLGFSESVSEHVAYLLDVVHGVPQEALAADEKTIGSSPEDETISHVDTPLPTPLDIPQAETRKPDSSSVHSVGEGLQDSTDDETDIGSDALVEDGQWVGENDEENSDAQGGAPLNIRIASDGREKVGQHMLNHEILPRNEQAIIHTNASADMRKSAPSADLISDAEIEVLELGPQPEQENVGDRAELVEEGGYDQLSEGNSPGSYEEDVAAELSAQTSESISDEELWEKIVQRDQAALREIMHRHSKLLKNYIFSILHNEHDAEDVVQEVWIECWKVSDSKKKKKGKLISWLYMMSRRRAIDKIRRGSAHQRAVDRLEKSGEYQLGASHAGFRDTSDDIRQNENRIAIQKALELIPVAQKGVIVRAFLEGMSQTEVAEATHAPLGTVKTRYDLGLKRLRWSLRHLREGYTDSDKIG